MSIPVDCPNCGHQFTSRAISITNSTDVTISGSESCPKCSGVAVIRAGTYDFVGAVMTAARAPGVLREDLVNFRDLVNKYRLGHISSEIVSGELISEQSPFADIWRVLNNNGTAIGVLLSILSIIISSWVQISGDSVSERAHKDAQNLIQIEERIYEALRERHSAAELMEVESIAKKVSLPISQTHSKENGKSVNRHERRKAARVSARKRSR